MSLPKLFFGTHNANKLNEIRQILAGHYEVVSYDAYPDLPESPETTDTLEGNATQKAEFYAQQTGVMVFADDSGLEVRALGGAPGVHSAYYAGPERSAAANIEKLLAEMEGVIDRHARFRTVIALKEPGKSARLFEGVLEGTIFVAPMGSGGFGYDPVFIPTNGSRSLAELSPEEKNAISHRGLAVRALQAFLLNE